MAEKEIKIGFPETKMEALEFFLRENDTTWIRPMKKVFHSRSENLWRVR